MYFDDIPDTVIERVRTLENLLVARATGDMTASTAVYEHIRRELMSDATLKFLSPDFVQTCRTLDVFWPYIKGKAGTYAERRQIIGQALTPLFDHLEGVHRAPADNVVADQIAKFDSDGVKAIWEKALSRRINDPEGAITVARTLLEAICKHILDARTIAYSDRDDLPKLYGAVAKALNLAPEQHSLEAIKAILGGAMTVVNGLGTLRNKLSDSHGRGNLPVKATSRHASLAVNMAGNTKIVMAAAIIKVAIRQLQTWRTSSK
jgi:hypothetical protein